MKTVRRYFAAGCAAAVMGMFFSDICGDFFNGMDYGSACILGMGMFLCVVIITCTGIVVSRLEQNGVPSDKKES